jgi:hypothetical protein
MNSPFSYTTSFTLNKVHFNECYSASVVVDHSIAAYSKAIVFMLLGLLLSLFSDINQYVAWFLVGLGFVEALSVYYQQPWWVMRQMLSRAANGDVTLILDEQGIHSTSFYLTSDILWQDITRLNSTAAGFLVQHAAGKSYISSACLSEQAKQFILAKCDVATAEQS